jgi:hypothetical protein
MEEIWKDIPGLEGMYQASNTQKIKSLSRLVRHPKGGYKKIRERIMAYGEGTNGYLIVGISIDGKTITKTAHRLIAMAFLPNPNNLNEVNHKDGNKKNNDISNLEWVTTSDNRYHAFRMGLQKASKHLLGKKDGLCRNSIPVVRILDNGEKELFESATTAERKLGLHRKGISECARGLREHSGGFKWQYL